MVPRKTSSNSKAPGTRGSGRRTWGRAQDDERGDPYRLKEKPSEPAVCDGCGVIHQHGRWQWGETVSGAHRLTCPACRRIKDDVPAGVVSLSGKFLLQHHDEIMHIIKAQEQAENTEHPMNRIMDIEAEKADTITVRTTDVHLPRRIGESIERACHGTLAEHFDEDGYFVRVNWHRDE
jgi:hypothetical protein